MKTILSGLLINLNLKHIIPTNIPEISKAYLGDDQVKKLTGDGGHVVIKIAPGGKQYSVFILAANDESFNVKNVYGPYTCLKN